MSSTAQKALQLLDSHGERLFRLLYRITLRHDVAEDLLQELMCSLLGSDTCWSADDPAAYASRMAMNLAFNWRRRSARTSTIPEPPAAVADSPIQNAVRREDYEQALKALSELSEAMRTILTLRYLQGESHDDIAEKLGKTPAQVRALCSKGLAELRQRLDAGRQLHDERA